MGPILDISPPLSRRLAVWPGDAPFALETERHPVPWGALEVGRIATTLHAGAHADAPCHYLQGGATMDQVDLAPYLGPCQVVDIALPPGARIRPEHLPALAAPRILFRTGSHPDKEILTRDYNSLSPELVKALKASGCLLVGIDTPSVDPFDSELEAHRALGECGMRVLEGLDLGNAAPGIYFLSALPLRVEGADGSPVRAVLVRASGS